MSDGSLSQDEIDALLQGSDDIIQDTGMSPVPSSVGMTSNAPLSQNEISAFQNLINSSAINEGEALGAMVGKTVTLTNPRIEIIQLSGLQKQLPDEIIEVKMDYDKGIAGEHSYILNIDTAKSISGLMMGQEGGELTDASLSAISEAMNTISGNASTTIGNQVKKEIRTAPPVIDKKSKSKLSISPNADFVKVMYDLTIENNRANLIEVFGINIVKEITSSVLPATNAMAGFSAPTQMAGQTNMMGQQTMNTGQMNVAGRGAPQVQNVQFSGFNDVDFDTHGGNINLLMDVAMELTVELGRTKKSIKYILGMGEGTVLELDKLAGEPVDILVNGKLIARGEVVVIDENFGVRVTEIISPADRIQELT